MNKMMLGMVLVLLLGGILVFAMKYSRLSQSQPNMVTLPQKVSISPTGTTQITPTSKDKQVSNILLTVSSPVNGQTVSTSSVVVRGKTVANAQVSINDVDTVADLNGNFSATVNLDEGDNEMTIVANDANGNYSEQVLTVTYNSVQ